VWAWRYPFTLICRRTHTAVIKPQTLGGSPSHLEVGQKSWKQDSGTPPLTWREGGLHVYEGRVVSRTKVTLKCLRRPSPVPSDEGNGQASLKT